MESRFKDSFSYLVAFLAVLVGLGIFKDSAEEHRLMIFGLSFNYLELSVPFIGLILLAVYVGALAMLSRNITFRLFPLTNVLERMSYTFAALGLLYPIVLSVTVGLSWLAQLLPPVDKLGDSLLTVAIVLQATYTAMLAWRYAASRQQDKYEVTLRNLREQVYAAKTPIDTKQISPYEIVMLYHQFVSLAKSLLKLKGYGISGENIQTISRSLEELKVFDKQDMRDVRKIRDLRNKIVHTDKPVGRKDLDESRKLLEDLVSKLKEAILSLEK